MGQLCFIGLMQLKLGTRRSLLARAQSAQVARAIEEKNPGVRVELVGIETQGDRITDIPLSQIDGKEFFVKELDEALLSRQVDLVVHSFKDLSLDRPSLIALAAIPKRENPRDIVLFSPEILARLKNNLPIRIGTSSPRRLENIPPFLARALPHSRSSQIQLEFKQIRGNVNTRLSRVHLPDSDDKRLDGVVLAFAGLARLWKDQEGQSELKKLLRNTKLMVLPIRENPTAPAQGALAIECLKENQSVYQAIHRLHDPETERAVRGERAILQAWGGGCHQRFGATQLTLHQQPLLFIAGKKQDGTQVDELRYDAPPSPKNPIPWDGMEWRSEVLQTKPIEQDFSKLTETVFVAHSRALPDHQTLDQKRVWTSGTPSWFRLAERGVWVEGCAEGLGWEWLKPTLAEPILQLAPLREWSIMTHDVAVQDWNECRVFPTYHVEQKITQEAKSALGQATHVFWGSFSQFEMLKNEIPSRVTHACGPGKTAAHLRAAGVEDLNVFPSHQEWRKWLDCN